MTESKHREFLDLLSSNASQALQSIPDDNFSGATQESFGDDVLVTIIVACDTGFSLVLKGRLQTGKVLSFGVLGAVVDEIF